MNNRTIQLDVSSFEKALASLEKAYVRADAAQGDEELRDGAIQRFEYTFELAWKMLKRQLEIDIENKAEVDSYSKRTLFRVGAERNLIDHVELWFGYLEHRNLTTHTYDSKNANDVFSVIASFIVDAKRLLLELKKRNA